MISMRPCGECAALVNAFRGCVHWRGERVQMGPRAPRGIAARERGPRYEENRRYQEEARERARVAVAQFRRMMNRPVTG